MKVVKLKKALIKADKFSRFRFHLLLPLCLLLVIHSLLSHFTHVYTYCVCVSFFLRVSSLPLSLSLTLSFFPSLSFTLALCLCSECIICMFVTSCTSLRFCHVVYVLSLSLSLSGSCLVRSTVRRRNRRLLTDSLRNKVTLFTLFFLPPDTRLNHWLYIGHRLMIQFTYIKYKENNCTISSHMSERVNAQCTSNLSPTLSFLSLFLSIFFPLLFISLCLGLLTATLNHFNPLSPLFTQFPLIYIHLILYICMILILN